MGREIGECCKPPLLVDAELTRNRVWWTPKYTQTAEVIKNGEQLLKLRSSRDCWDLIQQTISTNCSAIASLRRVMATGHCVRV